MNYLVSALLSFVLSFLICLILIPVLRRLKAGQNILSYVKEHQKKAGTPTMGGIAFLTATTVISACFVRLEKSAIVTLTVGLAYMTVGLLDDFLKQKHKENLGLKAYQKFAFQLAISVFVAIYAYRGNFTKLYIPFTRISIDIGAWIIPLVVFVFLATVNAVNLTDGLDGLASGVSIPFFAFLGVLILLQKQNPPQAFFCFCIVGALLAFLLFNTHPASIFMGDTGSLGLGGFAAAVVTSTGNALYLPVLGIMFVVSVISVIVQVIYYKATKGKRVFLMSPIHHHFQKKGYSETKIAYAYAVITLVMGATCVACIL